MPAAARTSKNQRPGPSAAAGSSRHPSRPSRHVEADSDEAFDEDEDDEDEDEEMNEDDDSEEDEWASERNQAGPSRARTFKQDDDNEEEDGVAVYESDQGEVIEEDSDPEASLGKQLAEIPFSSLLKAQKQLKKQQASQQRRGKKGTGPHDDDQEDGPEEEGSARRAQGKGKKAAGGKGKGRVDQEGRANKHAPTEISAKRPVSRVRQVVETRTLHARDPRFDSLSGSVNPHLFKQSYGFLADQQRLELETMRKTAAQAKRNRTLPQEEKDRIEEALKRMENREVTRRMREREQEAERSWKKEERDKRAQGKKAFYLKDTERKKLFLKAKFDELAQDKRKLHKAMDKKRKKTAQKEKKAMPNMRPSTGQ